MSHRLLNAIFKLYFDVFEFKKQKKFKQKFFACCILIQLEVAQGQFFMTQDNHGFLTARNKLIDRVRPRDNPSRIYLELKMIFGRPSNAFFLLL